MTTERVCVKCGTMNKISKENIQKAECYSDRGEYRRLLFCNCDGCGEKMILQADNIYTINLLKKIKYKIKQGKLYDKLEERLNNERQLLKSEAKGKILYDSEGNIFINYLTFI